MFALPGLASRLGREKRYSRGKIRGNLRAAIESLEGRLLLAACITDHYELLARGIVYQEGPDEDGTPGADHAWKVGDNATWNGYTVDRLWDDQTTGFFALGLVKPDCQSVLTIRGTEATHMNDLLADSDPKGVGFPQFNNNKTTVEEWLSNRFTATGMGTDLTGHSLGGSVVQWFATDFTAANGRLGVINTFNAAGIGATDANRFAKVRAGEVMHYITSGDLISMVGERFIEGKYTLSKFSDLNPLHKHSYPVVVNTVDGLNKPADLTQTVYPTVNSAFGLNSFFFSYVDSDYFIFLAAAEAVTISVPILRPFAFVPPSMLFRGTAEKVRKDIGKFLKTNGLPATGGIDSSKVYIHFPKIDFDLLGILKVKVEDLAITFRFSPQNVFRVQGKLTLPDLYNAQADFSGQNFIEIRQDGWDIAGKLSASNIKITAGFWEIKTVSLEFNTQLNRVRGMGTILIPGGIELSGDVIILNKQLDKIEVTADNINKPIGTTGAFLQKIGGGISNLAPTNPNLTTFNGTLGITAGPKVNINLPSWAGGHLNESLLSLEVSGKINKNLIDVSGTARLVGGLATGNASVTINFKPAKFTAQADLTVAGGLVRMNGLLIIDSNGNLGMAAGGSVNLPDIGWPISGQSLGQGDGQIGFTNNGFYGDDYVLGYGTVSTYFKDFTLGVKLYFDGSVSTITSLDDVPALPVSGAPGRAAAAVGGGSPQACFLVGEGEGFLIMDADWQNDAPPPAMRVVGPDSTVYDDSLLSSGAGPIRYVNVLSGPTARAVAVDDPASGKWCISILDDSGLGPVTIEGWVESGTPIASVDHSPSATDQFTINYTAFDVDSVGAVSLYLDDNSSGFDGLPIVLDLVESDGPGVYAFDGSNLPAGLYDIYIVVISQDGVYLAYDPSPISIEPNPPSISSMAAALDPLELNTIIHLSAFNAFDLDGDIANVSFYHDADNDGTWNPPTDILVGTGDPTGFSDWGLNLSADDYSTGAHRFFAVATDDTSLSSAPVSATVDITPPIITGTNGDDLFEVILAPDDVTVEIFVNTPLIDPPTYVLPVSDLASLTITGGLGNDTAIVLADLPFLPNFIGGPDSDTLDIAAGNHTLSADAASLGIEHLIVSGGALLTMTTSQHLQSFEASESSFATLAPGGGKVLRTNILDIGPAATLDLADNDLILDADPADVPAQLDYLTQLLATGRNTGPSQWRGPGIHSSAIPADGVTALGAISNDLFGFALVDFFAGERVSASSLLVKHTWNGDSEVDGVVTADDYFAIDLGYSLGSTGWINGDFDYSGSIDADDYFLIDAAFATQTGPLANPPRQAAPKARSQPKCKKHHLLFHRSSALLCG